LNILITTTDFHLGTMNQLNNFLNFDFWVGS